MNQSLGYPFMLNMWFSRRVDEPFLRGQVTLKRLTSDEVDLIITTPQNQ